MKALCLLLSFALSAAWAAERQPAPRAGPVKIPFKEVPGSSPLLLHVFYPLGHDPTSASPGIVLFFGGGWIQGNPEAMYAQCKHFASRGMVAISAQYRTKTSHGVFPDVCVMDGRSALRYVRAHAGDLGIDPNRILAGGGSAGGHVAACTALTHAPDDPKDDLSVSPKPVALVLFNPVLDVGPEGYAHGLVKYNTPDWKAICPALQADASFPPHLILLGSADKVIPVSLVENFQRKMKALGVFNEVEVYPDQEHGFFNRPPYLQKTLCRADEFLEKLGFVPSGAQ